MKMTSIFFVLSILLCSSLSLAKKERLIIKTNPEDAKFHIKNVSISNTNDSLILEMREGRYQLKITQNEEIEKPTIASMGESVQIELDWDSPALISEEEKEVWKKGNSSEEELTSFMKRFPHGRYAPIAKLKINRLFNSNNMPEISYNLNLDKEIEQELWKLIKSSKSIVEYQYFMLLFPKSDYIDDAYQEINKLAKKEKQTILALGINEGKHPIKIFSKQGDLLEEKFVIPPDDTVKISLKLDSAPSISNEEHDAWKHVENSTKAGNLLYFYYRFPESRYVPLAKMKISRMSNSINILEPPDSPRIDPEIEKKLWELIKASPINSLEYRYFVSVFPNSRHRFEANSTIAKLEKWEEMYQMEAIFHKLKRSSADEKAWQKWLKDFQKNNPDSLKDERMRQEAQITIEAIWEDKLKAMRNEFERLINKPGNLQDWQSWLTKYQDNNPYSSEDERMRQQIEKRIQTVWKNKLEGMRKAFYKILKSETLSRWQGWLSKYSENNPYSSEDETLRQRAQERIDSIKKREFLSWLQSINMSSGESISPVITGLSSPSVREEGALVNVEKLSQMKKKFRDLLNSIETNNGSDLLQSLQDWLGNYRENIPYSSEDEIMRQQAQKIIELLVLGQSLPQKNDLTTQKLKDWRKKIIDFEKDQPPFQLIQKKFDEVKNKIIVWQEKFIRHSLVLIQAGQFQIEYEDRYSNDWKHWLELQWVFSGDEGENRPRKTIRMVKISKPFFISDHEVTVGEYQLFNPNAESKNCSGENCPVTWVSWNDAKKYIEWLNDQTGYSYRFCTEAEWEYAARRGRSETHYCGEPSCMKQYARFGLNFKDFGPKPIKRYKPIKQTNSTERGLYDMFGNVDEWVSDWYEKYLDGPVTDPQGANSSLRRVIRGGNYHSTLEDLGFSRRFSADPRTRISTTGFRLCHDNN